MQLSRALRDVFTIFRSEFIFVQEVGDLQIRFVSIRLVERAINNEPHCMGALTCAYLYPFLFYIRGSQPGAKWPPRGPRDIEGGPRVQNRILGGHGRF